MEENRGINLMKYEGSKTSCLQSDQATNGH